MATAGSAERLRSPATAAAGRNHSVPGVGSNPLENEAKKCAGCSKGKPSGSPPCGHPACPLCRAQRPSGSYHRFRRRSDPERSSSRRDCDSRKGSDVSSTTAWKHKLSEDGEEVKRRNDDSHEGDAGALPDSENEEPISRRIRNISAFIRKTKNCSSFASGCRRSQSCTDPMENRGGKLKVVGHPTMIDRVGIGHSYTAGILLSSENSRSISAPIPGRRLTWRAVILSSSTPLVPALPRPKRSISPESNDSISEELNHFKPIVCSPCTPPKRLPDGRLMEPTIVKSTPRNLSRGLQKATSYEASPAVLQKWRQIELDRQSLKVNSKATLTSPTKELHNKNGGGEEHWGGESKSHQPSAVQDREGMTANNKRRLLFDPPDTDVFHKQSVKIRVPALHYSSEATFTETSGFDSTPESGSGGLFFNRKQSFSPYTKTSGLQACKLVPKDSQSPRKEVDGSLRNQSTSRRSRKRDQKTKHLDSDLKRSRPVSREVFDEQYIHQIQQEHQDRALALKLQRQFDLENRAVDGKRSPDTYFLRSWMSNQNRRRCGLRRSRRITKKH